MTNEHHTSAVNQFRLAADRLYARVSTWSPNRWQAPPPIAVGTTTLGGTAADRLRELLTFLADAAADASGEPRRPVPALPDHALPDQFAVLAHDLVATGDEAANAAALAALRAVFP